MKHKGLILSSTVIIFVLATVLSFVWLFRVRYIEVDCVAESSEKAIMYDKINGLLEDAYGGSSYFSIDEGEVIKLLTQDPYICVKSIKKVFPDRLQVSVVKRKERFAFFYGDETFVTDSEYILLRRETGETALEKSIIKIELNNIDLDTDGLKFGKKIGYENDKLVGCMTAIFNGFSDGLNLIDKVTVYGVQKWIRFQTKTGVCLDFSFAPSSPNASAETVDAEAEALVNKSGEVEKFYNELSEYKQRSGYVLVYTKANGEVAIEHTLQKVEVK